MILSLEVTLLWLLGVKTHPFMRINKKAGEPIMQLELIPHSEEEEDEPEILLLTRDQF